MMSSNTTVVSQSINHPLCCFGRVRLRTANLMIGYSQAVVVIVFGLTLFVMFTFGDENWQQHFVHDQWLITTFDHQTDSHNVQLIIGLLIVGVMLESSITVLLIVGVRDGRRGLMLPHLVLGAVAILSTCLRLGAALLIHSLPMLLGGLAVLAIEVPFFWLPLRYYLYLSSVSRSKRKQAVSSGEVTTSDNLQNIDVVTHQRNVPPSYSSVILATNCNPNETSTSYNARNTHLEHPTVATIRPPPPSYGDAVNEEVILL